MTGKTAELLWATFVLNLSLCVILCWRSVDKIEKNEIGGACSACGGQERFIQGFGGET
jgi:hypothetical protein